MSRTMIYHDSKNKDFHIAHSKRPNTYLMNVNHYHPQYEIYYLMSGDRNYFIQNRIYKIEKGDLVLINSNLLHKTVCGSSDYHERMLIEFDISFLNSFLVPGQIPPLLAVFHDNRNLLRLKEPERKLLESCFFKIIRESRDHGIENNISLKIYFIELLNLINGFAAGSEKVEYEHPSQLHKKVSEIVAYMNQNFTEDINLETVAARYFISSAHLSRIFKKATGFTFIEYLTDLRIHEAQRLLSETSLRLSEIAARVGYQNHTHFGRMFKLITGNSPRDYRKLTKHP